MASGLGELAYAAADGAGVNWLARRLHRDQVIVLMYHGLAPDDSPVNAWTVVREGEFRWQMDHLARHCEVLPVDRLLDDADAWRPGGKRKVLITFDDGYRSNYTLAEPILRERGLAGTVFVATGFIGTGHTFWYDKVIHAVQVSGCSELDLRPQGLELFRFASRSAGAEARWSGIQHLLTRIKTLGFEGQLRLADHVSEVLHANLGDSEVFAPLSRADVTAMHRGGVMSIGSHTHRHEILTQVSAERARETIAESLTELHGMTGAPCRTFSYPNGDHNAALGQLLGQMGIRCAFTTTKGFWRRQGDPLAIPRIGVGGYDSRERFAAVVSGLALAR